MSSSKPLLAFFGATGGSTISALVPALKDSYDCLALVRTPSKLTSLLLEKGVSQSSIDAHLHITSGDVLKSAHVKASLTLNGRCADIIISGIGVPAFMAKEEITICRNGVTNILTALREIKPENKPLLIALSTTGIARGGEKKDLPLLMKPLYTYGLHAPHEDKTAMEGLIVGEVGKGEESMIRGFVMPRPSMLADGKAKGLGKIRVGTETEPAVGYAINRDDVGMWVYEKVVKEEGGKWVGRKPTLTY